MQYALLFYSTDRFSELPPALREDWLAQIRAWMDAAREAGVLRSAFRLAPASSATSVRYDGDAALITDGPFAETKEMLAGFALLECPDLDAALAWARRCPLARAGTVEVRPQHPDAR
jgi:hypothetical protein